MRRASLIPVMLLAGWLGLSGCYIQTQRLPAPMDARADSLPPGSKYVYAEGPEEVLVIRHADPVQVRPAGLTAGYPLPFYNKQTRMNSGVWVSCGAGGRAEVRWADGGSIVLYGNGTGVVGSASRGEPTFIFEEVERASIHLKEEGQVELLGGSVLVSATGPFIIEHPRPEILRVRNRSKGIGRLAFRDAVLDLDPGQVVDLPLIEAGLGGVPFQMDPEFETLTGVGVSVDVRGTVEAIEDPRGLRLVPTGDHELRAGGVRVRLDPGEEAVFGDLSRPDDSPDSPGPRSHGSS